MRKKFKLLIVFFVILCFMSSFTGFSNAEPVAKSETALPAIQSIDATNGSISIHFDQSSSGLSAGDFIVTANLGGTDVMLIDPAFDSSTNSFSFYPYGQTIQDQTLIIAVSASPSSSLITGSASASIIIPADLTEYVALPEASIPSGTAVHYNTPVFLSCSTEGAEIYYSLNFTTFKVYDTNNPPLIKSDSNLRIYASKDGMYSSDTTVYNYTVDDKAALPAASPRSGAVGTGTPVTLSCTTPGTVLYYTIDGTEPTADSAVFTSPIIVNSDMTIKAIAVKEGIMTSDTATFAYRVLPQVPAPSISPQSGIVTYGTPVLISIWGSVYEPIVSYTIDGSYHKSGSCYPWGGPSFITNVYSDITVTAHASKSGMADSKTVTASYICKASKPSAISGMVKLGTQINLWSNVPGATYYYTVDGSDPSDKTNPNRILYSSDSMPVVNSSMVIKAVTVNAGILDSDVATFTYDIMQMELGYYFDKKKLDGFTISNNYGLTSDIVADGIDIAGTSSEPDIPNFGNLKVWYDVHGSDGDVVRKLTLKSADESHNTILMDFKAYMPIHDTDIILTLYVKDVYGMLSSISCRISHNGKLEPIS